MTGEHCKDHNFRKAEEFIKNFDWKTYPDVLRQLYNSTTNGYVFVMLDTGLIVDANTSFEKRLGYAPGELDGKDVRVLFLKKEFNDVWEDIRKNPKEGHSLGEHLLKTKDKGSVMHAVSYQMVNIGSCRCAVLICEEIEELTRLKELAAKRERMLTVGELAAGIAHEFNNILGGVMGYIDFALHYDKSPATVRKALDLTQDALERISHLTSNFRSFAEALQPHFERVKVHDLIAKTLTLLEEGLQEAGVTAEKNLQRTPLIQADKTQLEQLFRNMVVNAIEAMPNGGKLTVTLRRVDKDYILVQFKDTGFGISQKNVDKVFNPFFTTKGVMGGGDKPASGLGLAVCQGIVEVHKGRIEVSSQVGVGTTFDIYLPISQGGENRAINVMIVDDEQSILDILSTHLANEGYTVTPSRQAKGVLEKIEQTRPHIIFLDYMMPDMNGIQLLQKIRSVYPDIPVVILTAYGQPNLVKDAISLGAKEYILKPFTLSQISDMIEKYVKQ